jgi:hypothetical protein
MPAPEYDIYFSGRIIEGRDPEQVREKIGKLFKMEPEQVAQLFSGKAARIKAGVDQDTAVKYRTSFQKAGAQIEIRPVTKEAAIDEERAESGEAMTLLPPKTGSLIDCAPEIGPAPIPDISALNLSSEGSILDETEEIPTLEIDTSELILAPVASDLGEEKEVPPANIDTGELSVSPPQTGTLEDCHTEKEPTPIPDISRLHLEDEEES